MVQIRDFRESDASAVREMMVALANQRKESTHHLVLKEEYSRFFSAYMLSFLKDPDAVVKVAEDNGTVVGYAIATRSREAPFLKYSQVGRLSDVYVKQAYRGHGVAKQLLQALEAWARKARLQALEVDVFPEHEDEIQALLKLGFVRYRVKFLRPFDEAPPSPVTRREEGQTRSSK